MNQKSFLILSFSNSISSFFRIRIAIILFGWIGITPISFSQKIVQKSQQQWIQSYHEGKVSSKWTALLDGGFRWKDGFAAPNSYIVRGGMGYSLSPRLRVAGGLAHLGFYAENRVIRQEFRPYQEVSHKSSIGKVNLSQRFRLEERFFKSRSDSFDFDLMDFNYRLRYSLMVAIPIVRLSAKHPERKLLLNLGDEIFLNAGKEVKNRVFDQNRFILSPSVQWNQSLNIAFTWNTQYASATIPNHFNLSHVAWLQIRHNLNFINGKEPRN